MSQPKRAPRTRERIQLPGQRRHGTESGYTYGCSCPACRQAVREAVARRCAERAEKLRLGKTTVQHGTLNAYRNYNCRCPQCTEANRLAQRKGPDLRETSAEHSTPVSGQHESAPGSGFPTDNEALSGATTNPDKAAS